MTAQNYFLWLFKFTVACVLVLLVGAVILAREVREEVSVVEHTSYPRIYVVRRETQKEVYTYVMEPASSRVTDIKNERVISLESKNKEDADLAWWVWEQIQEYKRAKRARAHKERLKLKARP